MRLDVLHDLIQFRERQSHIAVRTSIIQRDLPALRIVNGGTGKTYIRHKAPLLIPLFRCQQEVLTPIQNLGWIIDIQNRAADGIDEAVAGTADTMVEQQPSLTRLDGRGATADLDRFPPLGTLAHHMSVFAPVYHIRTIA